MQFSYKATKANGETYQGVREASDKFALFRDLRKEGETVLSCEEVKTKLLQFVYPRIVNVACQKVIDYTPLWFPVVGQIIKETNSARTARTLSSLLASGVDIVIAIRITSEVLQNSFYKKVLADVANRVEKGELLSGVFLENEHLYPVFVGEMTNVGEETGELSKMFLGIAEFYEEEVEQKTKDILTILKLLLMVFISLGIGLFAILM